MKLERVQAYDEYNVSKSDKIIDEWLLVEAGTVTSLLKELRAMPYRPSADWLNAILQKYGVEEYLQEEFIDET